MSSQRGSSNTKVACIAAGAAATVAGLSKLFDQWVINRPVSSIETAIETFRNGRPLIVMDDEDRENEGDIIVPAQDLTEELAALIVNETTGILCAPMTEDLADRLGMHQMVDNNTDPKGTAFTVTTDLKPLLPEGSRLIGTEIADASGHTGITTGVSAHDRMKTFRALSHPDAQSSDFCRPGHIFPLRAKRGGVKDRRGHTEASVDLCRLAHRFPVGCIGELINKWDGSMKRLDDCKRLSWKLGIPIITIDALSNYLYKKPISFLMPKPDVVAIAECMLPITRQRKFLGTWKMMCFKERQKHEHIVMVLGDVTDKNKGLKEVPVRIHSECFTGDVLGSMRCDCGEQLDLSFSTIHNRGAGIIIYMTGHEGRGIGLVNKMHAYKLQSQGMDTYRANRELGFADDMRSFDCCTEIISLLGVKGKKVKLLTNSPLKARALSALKGRVEVEAVPLLCEHNEYNTRYLTDKRNHETRLREGGLASKPENITASLRLSDRAHMTIIPKLRVVIIRTVWFGKPLKALSSQIVSVLKEAGIPGGSIGEVTVPGAGHLPFAAKAVAATQAADAIVCLGITMKGELMPHAFACMSSAVANGLTLVQIQQDAPVLFGVLACEHKQQVVDRCSAGGEWAYGLALSAIQVAAQHRMIPGAVDPTKALPSFPQDNNLSSPVVGTMRQSVAANETQAEELSSHLSLPTNELAQLLRVTIIATAWHRKYVDSYVSAARGVLLQHGLLPENISFVRVAGSFEIPFASRQAIKNGADAVMTCGVLVKGKTAHFEYVALAEALGSVDLQLQYDTPIVSGVLLCATHEQMVSRVMEAPVPLAQSVLHQAVLARAFKPLKATAALQSFGAEPDAAAPSFGKAKDIPACLEKPTPQQAKNLRVGIVRTAWNEAMVQQMKDGVCTLLEDAGIPKGNMVERVVPGSYELPQGALMLTMEGEVDVVLCLGVLIKGDTKHFEYICQATSHGILKAQNIAGVPMLYGVLTCYSVEQAAQRAKLGSELHATLAASVMHQALLFKAFGGTATRCPTLVDVPTRTIPPAELRAALLGELVKDIPRTLQAPAESVAADINVAVVATSNEEVELVQQMVDGILAVFTVAGLPDVNICVRWVPTSFDLPQAVAHIMKGTKVDAIIAVGVLIEDNTAMFSTACEASSHGLMEASLSLAVPVLFGVLTCHTHEQACQRAQKGSELHYSLAMSTLHMACLRRRLGQRQGGLAGSMGVKAVSAVVPPSVAAKLRVCLVRTSWNENEVLAVLGSLRGLLLDAGVKISHIMEEVVPGTYELPYTAQQLTKSNQCDVICLLGTMVQGDTANYEYMAAASVRGFTVVGVDQPVPVVWGVQCVRGQEELASQPPGEVELLASRILQTAMFFN